MNTRTALLAKTPHSSVPMRLATPKLGGLKLGLFNRAKAG